ncbi:MAG: ArnT family glycosyltransferase [Acidiferrobacterales bacterium]
MFNFLTDENLRLRYWWPALSLLALFAYLYSLGSLHIPNIGDEQLYFQIAHRAAESGNWLPLKADDGLDNTKPPLLFWQGIVSTGWGKNWSTLSLRLPIVIYTFLTALLIFSLARHISGRRETAYIAALSFLGFSSTFQHGRPFLTNMPETFFMFLVFYLLLRFRRFELHWHYWVLAGVLIGLASLYRSFAVIAPIALALGWYLWWRRKWNLIETIKRDSWKPAVAVIVALAIFALWPLLDPEPGLIFQNFFLKENVGKFGRGNYFQGLITGPYTLFRVWFGAVTNAGVLALPIVYLAIVSFRQRRVLMSDEKALWILVFSYLVAFSLPAQRQENYILPIMPALAVLLAMQWDRIDRRWFIAFNLPILVAIVLFSMLMFALATGEAATIQYAVWHPAVLLLALVILAASLIWLKYARHFFLVTVFLAYLGFSSVLAPFDGPTGRFSKNTIAQLQGKTVYVPTNIYTTGEKHRFIIPGADVKGYRREDVERRRNLIANGRIVAIRLRLRTPIPEEYIVYGERLVVRSRLNAKELSQILFQQRTDIMLSREIVVQLKTVS